MGLRSTGVAVAVLAVLQPVPPVRSETLYFNNKRTLEVTSYQVKGPLIYVTLQNGKIVYLRADSVDWEGTTRLKQPGMMLQATDYESVDEAGGLLDAPAERLTASDLRKSGVGFKLRRAGATSTVVEVPAGQSWVDSRVTVRAGQTVVLHSSGTVTVAPGIDVGPDGTSSASTAWSTLNPKLPFGALLVRIGLGSEPVAVGATLRLVATTGGRIFFTVNDKQLGDNNGAFSVRIEMPQGSGPGTTAGYHSSPADSTASSPAKGMVGAIDRARSVRDTVQQGQNP